MSARLVWVCSVMWCLGCGASADADRDEVQIPGGVFTMGCLDTASFSCPTEELPRHEVTISPFFIDRHEVSVAQYVAFLNDHGNVCNGHACAADSALYGSPPILRSEEGWVAASTAQGDQAVTMVSWYGAAAFCAHVDARLCSESEWERAASGPCDAPGGCTDSAKTYPWGEESPTCSLAHMMASTKGCDTGQTASVESYPDGQSTEGVINLAGNAWEWVDDAWHAGYEGHPTDGSAWSETATSLRVVRGGGLGSLADTLRSAHRWNAGPQDLSPDYGFRCCRDAQ